jgi:hypothetical protein
MFKITTESGVQKVVHKFDSEAERAHDKQRKMPVRMTEYKKVTKLESEKLTENVMIKVFSSCTWRSMEIKTEP